MAASSGMRIARQHWETVLSVHWRVEPRALEPLLPPEVSLDTFDGDAFLSLSTFWVIEMRPSVASFVALDFVQMTVTTPVTVNGVDAHWLLETDLGSTTASAAYRVLMGDMAKRAHLAWTRDHDVLLGEGRHDRAAISIRGHVQSDAELDALDTFLAERDVVAFRRRESLRAVRITRSPHLLQRATTTVTDHGWLPGVVSDPRPARVTFAEGYDVDVALVSLTPSRDLPRAEPASPLLANEHA